MERQVPLLAPLSDLHPDQNTPLSEPGIVGYHAKAKALYDSLRQRQKDYPQRLANGETLEALTEETWQLLCDNA